MPDVIVLHPFFDSRRFDLLFAAMERSQLQYRLAPDQRGRLTVR